jgi:Fuc2NAc and GlcNAc transferase
MSAGARILGYGTAAAGAVLLLGGLPSITIGAFDIHLGISGVILAIVGTIWLTNLYNFMDGIDGLAGLVAAIVGCGYATLLWLADAYALAIVAMAVAASAAGFLILNWQPARIFMGDVGSSFLGFTFAILALASERARAVPLFVLIIPLLPFCVDTTVTLVWRRLRGQAVTEAHRDHAYQRAVQSGLSHARVATLVGGMSLGLIVVAYYAWRSSNWTLPLVAAAVAVLGGCYSIAIRRGRAAQTVRPYSVD